MHGTDSEYTIVLCMSKICNEEIYGTSPNETSSETHSVKNLLLITPEINTLRDLQSVYQFNLGEY